jgi:hypothetical protein
LEDFLKFSWAAAGLLLFHLYDPYLTFIIDQQATHSKCIEVFGQLYEEMMNPLGNFSKLTKPAIKALERSWCDPFSKDSSYEK